ncbi:MAG: prolyl oligopeptidase family serine peptidase [Trueperaceae bacterium]
MTKIASSVKLPTPEHDPYPWLETVEGDEALAWVREQNKVTQRELEALPNFEPLCERVLTMLDSEEKIPFIRKHGQWYYNFWQDKNHVRGLWRRTTLEEYRKEKPNWELVLDLDKLATEENENWVWKGTGFLEPENDRCLLYLSRGGSDAAVIREFNVLEKSFIKDGFVLPESKGQATYRDQDSLFIGRDFGDGTLTTSGYPRIVKEWQRHTPLAEAKTVFEGHANDVWVSGAAVKTLGSSYEFVEVSKTFWLGESFLRQGEKLIKLEIPEDAALWTQMMGEWLLLSLKSSYKLPSKTYSAGALIAIRLQDFLQGSRDFYTLFQPAERKMFESYIYTKHHLLLLVKDNLEPKLYALKFSDGTWSQTELGLPVKGNITMWAEDAETSDGFFLEGSDYLTPSNFYYVTPSGKFEQLKQAPAWYDGGQFISEKFEVASKDGVAIPYFVVRRKDVKFDGKNPTMLYGYGGFEVSMGPGYKSAAWLDNGGIYVEAILRGGGEFGPDWHWAATKENKQRTFDDFIAIAEDLIARKITSPEHLGIMGGSNGGLLMGAMLTQRPDLFKAIVCAVPLLDMYRYNVLLAGASWMAEYGDPNNPEEWAYIQKYSPYHNVKAGMTYPRVLFTTSTKDDRVHPGHARKMMALLKDLGYDVLLYENIEGGHAGAANNQQAAYSRALSYAFLLEELS